MKEKVPKENKIRHDENLSILTGMFYKGRFWRDGIPQTPKPKDLQDRGSEKHTPKHLRKGTTPFQKEWE